MTFLLTYRIDVFLQNNLPVYLVWVIINNHIHDTLHNYIEYSRAPSAQFLCEVAVRRIRIRIEF